jgi:hypothetical protein
MTSLRYSSIANEQQIPLQENKNHGNGISVNKVGTAIVKAMGHDSTANLISMKAV